MARWGSKDDNDELFYWDPHIGMHKPINIANHAEFFKGQISVLLSTILIFSVLLAVIIVER